MNEAGAVDKSTLVNPGTKLAYTTPESAPQVPGRRKFFTYTDLGSIGQPKRFYRALILP